MHTDCLLGEHKLAVGLGNFQQSQADFVDRVHRQHETGHSPLAEVRQMITGEHLLASEPSALKGKVEVQSPTVRADDRDIVH
jgi:hypothetical protein